MLVRERFQVQVPDNRTLPHDLPLWAEIEPGVACELIRRSRDSLQLVVERHCDPLDRTLEASTGFYKRDRNGEEREVPGLRVPGNWERLRHGFPDVVDLLTDVPFMVGRPFDESELVPENDEETAALNALGTRRLFAETRVLSAIRTFNQKVDEETIRRLLPNAAGLRLYADALVLTLDVAKFRELWRVLESAFGLQNDHLVNALATYAPAEELGFDRDELRDLVVLRGQLSHAATKGGRDEILRVGREASQRIGRLKCLVERVILTKQSWGTRSRGVKELTVATSWINRDGNVVVNQTIDP